MIVMSFSGGGLRAATLAASILDALKERGLQTRSRSFLRPLVEVWLPATLRQRVLRA